MEIAAITIICLNFAYIGYLILFFFAKKKSINLRVILCSLPLALWMIPCSGIYYNYLTPSIAVHSILYLCMTILGAECACGSIIILSLAWAAHQTPPCIWHQNNLQPQALITHGIYHYIRHPFYSAYVLSQIACLLIAPHPLQLCVLIWQITAIYYTATIEENQLLHGPLAKQYQQYQQITGQFIPHISCYIKTFRK